MVSCPTRDEDAVEMYDLIRVMSTIILHPRALPYEEEGDYSTACIIQIPHIFSLDEEVSLEFAV